jgi:hypothetical protein
MDKIEKITQIGKSLQTAATDAVKQKVSPVNPDHFEALMKQQKTDESTKANAAATDNKIVTDEAKKPSLMDEVKNSNRLQTDGVSKTSPTQLIAQSQETIDRISKIKEVLSTSNVEIKNSYQSLLKNKLTHIDENLKIALSKAGAEFPSAGPTPTQGLLNPIERYMGYLTNSQYQLQGLTTQIQTMSEKDQLSPASMLAIQIKVGYVQQELEFFTSLLNKAIESTKTLMNVQV